MSTTAFANRPRFDAVEKVRGSLRYAADVPLPGMHYAMMVPSRIAKGRVISVATEEALALPGVIRVLTAADFPPPPVPVPGSGGPPPPPTIIDEIAYRGQPVALVVAQSLEAAIEGAEAVTCTYAEAPFSPLIDSEGGERQPTPEVKAGDAAASMDRAVHRFKAEYQTPAQHHNPIEMLSTTAVWENGRLTIYEGSQHTAGVKNGVAGALRLDPRLIDVKSPSTGGGFGQKGAAQRQSALVAQAAILTGRPVKLVVPRGQIFHNATFRPRSRHSIELGADAGGRMIAVRYDADQQQSRRGQFPPHYHDSPVQLYGVDYLGTAANVRIDTQSPGYMRAPCEQPGLFAFESAIDEFAEQLGVDPVAFRLAHDTAVDPTNGRPLSSRHLHECIREGARRFGWERRSRAPGSMIAEDGTQIGWGMASGAYQGLTTPTIATLRIGADGSTRFAVAGHEMGQGIRSVIAAVLMDGLAIDPAKLDIQIGDTTVAPQHITAGSWGTASVVPAAHAAVQRMNAAMEELLAGREVGGNLHRKLATVRRPSLQVEVSNVAPGQGPEALDRLRQTGMQIAGPDYPDFTTFSYIAHFVEVRVEPRTRRIRVPRVVSIADCGRVVAPRPAESQVRGGVVWAISAALREETEVDPRFGGWLNSDLADYVLAVNADIGEIDVGFIDKPDPLTNAVGTKGLGEVAMVGASAAIANAIYHATGKRLRELPIRIEDLL
ncbi:xanthine dehydrogenase family protein molybdopterin-binding subunit [Terrihabitans rhizophilus]|uniref:Xanthine dehydrogenase family protein molybdopterin-binding subunit n=1 Tax=Terrihabitans rhizophilus TaxID=3092662 RepID=A0ABU4RJ61_9HYPH|nr:xanthine dehydrogenase family protein molybdopterin-binding subunit [Terrihabitans sp. PJ23]MDX6804872.1 xanthine dehydrogenase family protein molybdopterin-binding subunit [Terrihabitans sp. PJ23]